MATKIEVAWLTSLGNARGNCQFNTFSAGFLGAFVSQWAPWISKRENKCLIPNIWGLATCSMSCPLPASSSARAAQPLRAKSLVGC